MKASKQRFIEGRYSVLHCLILNIWRYIRLKYSGCIRMMILLFFLLLWSGTQARAEFFHEYEALSPTSLISSLKTLQSLDFCGEVVPLNDRDVRERLEREFLVTVWNRPQVILWMKRSGRYMSYIEEMLKQNNMPDDLKYLVIVESSLISHVTSPRGAGGYWQFMEGTAKKYGLSVNSYLDERRNFYSSTRAALSYLRELHKMLGSWTLAAAAYNMGEEGLKSEILIQKTNNYYLLYLPVETQRYIFRALSAKLILSDPRKYGYMLQNGDLYRPLPFDRVEVVCEESIPILIIAQAAKTYFKEIKELNPEIKGYYLHKGRYVISVPQGGGGDGFHTRYNELLRQWREERKKYTYIVKKGESLSSISSRFKVPLPALLIWNRLESSKHVKAGDQLLIFPAK